MVQVINQTGGLFGELGKGFGQGLAEQLPKEAERYRLSQGLKALENEPNLSPTQRYGRLLTLPGMTPQGLQGYSDLARQEIKGKALIEQGNMKPSPFPVEQTGGQPKVSEIPSLTQSDTFAKAQEGSIPRTEQEKLAAAGQKYNQNPALFGNDPQKAIEYENQIDATNQARAQAYQTKHENLSRIQDNVVSRLRSHADRLEAKIPETRYSKIEDEAIQATKPISEGGRGLTEQQAMKEYGAKIDEESRDQSALNALGGIGVMLRPASSTTSSLAALQAKAEKRGETENMADQLISNGGFSPLMAYSLAQPVKREPNLNNELSKLREVYLTKTEDPIYETEAIAPRLAKSLGKKGSPLAVAHELQKKGYDANSWLDYLVNNRNELDLSDWQGRQLDKARNLVPTWNDWWLGAWSGIDKRKEK